MHLLLQVVAVAAQTAVAVVAVVACSHVLVSQ
jgi:hypothetical protein